MITSLSKLALDDRNINKNPLFIAVLWNCHKQTNKIPIISPVPASGFHSRSASSKKNRAGNKSTCITWLQADSTTYKNKGVRE